MPDLTRVLELFQRAEALFHRHLRVDSVQLVKIDPLQLQPPQAHYHALLKVFWPSILSPLIRTGAGEAALGRNYQVLLVGITSFRDDVLADLGAIRIRCVNKVHTE